MHTPEYRIEENFGGRGGGTVANLAIHYNSPKFNPPITRSA